jgi:hypothetical protein
VLTFLRRARHGIWRWYRRPLLLGLIVALVATALAVTVGGRAGPPTTTVVVVARDVEAGRPLTGDDLHRRPRPVGDIPVDAVVDDPVGRTPLVGLVAGEVVLERRLAPGGVGAVASLVAPGAVGVWLPPGGLPVQLAVGDRLDLLLIEPGRTRPVVEAAPIVGVDEGGVTVAVPTAIAPSVVEAVALGQLAPVVAPSWPGDYTANATSTTTPSTTR